MAKQADPAALFKTALTAYLATAYPTAVVGLEVPDNYIPTNPFVLVADDGGPLLKFRIFAEPLMRVTVFARGRSQARLIARDCAHRLQTVQPAGIARIKNVSALLEAKDTQTGAYMASFTVPVIVRPIP